MGNSLMIGCAKLGLHFTACAPEKYFPDEALVEACRIWADKSGGSITLESDPVKATKDADVIYTDVWVSMGEPDEVWEERIGELSPYKVTMDIMNNASQKAIFMHCLPAFHDLKTKIGAEMGKKFNIEDMEVTDEVFTKYSKVLFDEAENRMHTIKAVMAATLGYDIVIFSSCAGMFLLSFFRHMKTRRLIAVLCILAFIFLAALIVYTVLKK